MSISSLAHPLHHYLQEIHQQFSALTAGEVASYIPQLARANPEHFGIVLVATDGEVYAVGDTDVAFTMQSISKPFVYATALADCGLEAVLQKIHVEPTGDAFNSISLHPTSGAPLNPMINAGAIVAAGLVDGTTPARQWQRILGSLSAFAGRQLAIDDSVYQSESDTGFRNRAIGWMVRNFGIIETDPTPVVENYFRQCSVLVTCRDLGMMGATLANGGLNPLTGERVLPDSLVRPTLAVMSTCGMYDYAGSWMFEVGLPAKSGVSGGILAVLPGRFAVVTYSPRLDAKGNSVRGIEVCKAVSKNLGLHMMDTPRNASQVISREFSGTEVPSNRVRSAVAKQSLDNHSQRIRFFTLQGDITLDGAELLSRRLVKDSALTHVVLDMHRVTLCTPPAAKLLVASIASLWQRGGDLAFARIRQDANHIEATLHQGLATDGATLHVFPDTDRAMEWCEDQILLSFGHPAEQPALHEVDDFELFAGLQPADRAALVALLQEFRATEGSLILHAGEQDDDRIFLLRTGEVSVLVTVDEHHTQRLATLGPGQTFGEMTILDQLTRTATVRADTDIRCWALCAADLNRLAASRPQLKIMILGNLARLQAQQRRQANALVATLAR